MSSGSAYKFPTGRSAGTAAWLRGVLLAAGLGCAAVLAAGATYLGLQYLGGNFHTVVAGELYRSGQPTPGRLRHYVHEAGIRTVINLRGRNTGAAWYDAEIAEAARLGVTHVDFAMSASRELSGLQADALVQLLRNAEKPILIHCEGGADRSGLAAALYLAAISKTSEAQAESQMSLRFGHFSLPFLRSYAMDDTFENLEASLGYTKS
ncbi:tyrosine-protein phosphatase [Labrys neptuniae]|uniref:Tyrosine-protein phosphatase n=1 Tax=Labrys neptuniae TaxID=376174 RepID=A0ABV3PQM0_9HYPH|nr:tyrosine-protein phosphatase [Labrys neptuniae]MDT3381131.1 tyrosine-protein phosphatase [Labrys neptuniae]